MYPERRARRRYSIIIRPILRRSRRAQEDVVVISRTLDPPPGPPLPRCRTRVGMLCALACSKRPSPSKGEKVCHPAWERRLLRSFRVNIRLMQSFPTLPSAMLGQALRNNCGRTGRSAQHERSCGNSGSRQCGQSHRGIEQHCAAPHPTPSLPPRCLPSAPPPRFPAAPNSSARPHPIRSLLFPAPASRPTPCRAVPSLRTATVSAT